MSEPKPDPGEKPMDWERYLRDYASNPAGSPETPGTVSFPIRGGPYDGASLVLDRRYFNEHGYVTVPVMSPRPRAAGRNRKVIRVALYEARRDGDVATYKGANDVPEPMAAKLLGCELMDLD